MKRWLIRSVFMLPILFCLLAWGRSIQHDDTVGYAGGGVHAEVDAYWGSVHLTWERGKPGGSGFYCQQEPTFDAHFWPVDRSLGTYAGFGFHRVTVPRYTYRWASCPYWFLLLLSFLLLIVWRKTRPRKIAQGFPVETNAQKPHPGSVEGSYSSSFVPKSMAMFSVFFPLAFGACLNDRATCWAGRSIRFPAKRSSMVRICRRGCLVSPRFLAA